MADPSPSAARARRGLNQLVALAFGAVYLLVGLAGFVVTGDNLAGEHGESLLGFDVTILHNLVHLAIGAVLVLAARSLPAARSANLAIGAAYLLLGLLGGLINDSPVDVIGLNRSDHFLHLASGLLLLGIGLAADNRPAGEATTESGSGTSGEDSTGRTSGRATTRTGSSRPIGTIDQDGSGSRRLAP